MARIPAELLKRLGEKLGIGKYGVYYQIGRVATQNHLPRDLAAIKLAMESRINVNRWATPEQLREIRGASTPAAAAIAIPAVRRASRGARQSSARTTKKTQGTSVFVVHGRNDKIRANMFGLLRAVGLHPLEWSQARKLTGRPNPHIGEILDAAFKEAQAIVVLFTPDELVQQKKEFIRKNDPEHERNQTEQSRPNVLFESGMAMGRDPDRTVLVEIGAVRPFSDIAGRHLLRFDGSPEARHDLLDRLESAGCKVRRDGMDWIRFGDFAV